MSKKLDQSSAGRRRRAESQVAAVFQGAGWQVHHTPSGRFAPDMVVHRGDVAYAVALKAASEGRSDRLIPLLAMAVLHAARSARKNQLPLAVVFAPKIATRAAEQLLQFARDYANHVAVGVIDAEGLRRFSEPALQALDSTVIASRVAVAALPKSAREAPHLFSDLNQWMLKVLLAPEFDDALLGGRRGRYHNASQLAEAAEVSVMSAFRLVQQLRDEGYLHESAEYLQLVRRRDLFARWQAAADRPCREVQMRFRLPGNPDAQLRKVLASGRACLGLFAAARNLGYGFVEGVPPHAYVERVRPLNLAAWKNLRVCEAGEPADVILRQAPAPQSIFRAMVRPNALASCDILQVWLDVAAHPARGAEQADLIRERVLAPVINKEA